MIQLPDHGLYAITDCEHLAHNEVIEKTEDILRAGATLLQYRNKDTNIDNKSTLAYELQILCREFNRIFIINDDVELARKINADGIHLGKNDHDIRSVRTHLGQVIIGVSCYNEMQRAINAENDGADYVAFGSFFLSLTKPRAVRADKNLIKQAKKKLKLPVVAIGGITPENGKLLIKLGVNYLAVISGLYSVDDSYEATQAYLRLFVDNV